MGVDEGTRPAARHWHQAAKDVRPMLVALVTRAPLSGEDLVFEPKYDGIRALVERDETGVRIWARSGAEKTLQFPEVAEAFAAVDRVPEILVDGEIVALDKNGEPVGFGALQERIHLSRPDEAARRARNAPVAFLAFDLLREGSADLRPLPLIERKVRLEQRLGAFAGRTLRLGRWAMGDGRALLEEARQKGWEGVVVKDARSAYRSGERGPQWRKIKLVHRQELVVGGWTEPRGSREALGALLLGVWQDGALRYVGHVGTGFDRKGLREIAAKLAPIETSACPFTARPDTNERPHWTKPEIVVEVKFGGLTEAGLLRHPVFIGVRDDKKAEDVRAEEGDVEAARSVGRAPGSAGPQTVRPSERTQSQEPPPPPEVARVIEQLEQIERGRGSGRVLLPNGGQLQVTNLGKPFWPALGTTKGDLLRYYARVSPLICEVVRDRPLVMRRFPNGVQGEAFYQHRAPEPLPAGVRAAALPNDDVPSRLVGGDLVTLLYMAQLASVSQDPWFSRVGTPEVADEIAFDLDPMPEVPFERVLDVARWIRDELGRLDVPAFPKTSGATGLHVFVPMPEGTTYETGRLFAQIVATVVAGKHPKVATVERTVDARGATVYVDYLQNIGGKTLACAYSARASEYAGVSAPLTWREVDEGVDARDFTMRSMPARLADVGDLWAGLRRGPRADLHSALQALLRTGAPQRGRGASRT